MTLSDATEVRDSRRVILGSASRQRYSILGGAALESILGGAALQRCDHIAHFPTALATEGAQ